MPPQWIIFRFGSASGTTYHNVGGFSFGPPLISTSEEERFAQNIQLINGPQGNEVAITAHLADYGTGSLSGGIQIHRFDVMTQEFNALPNTIIVGDGN